MIPKLIALVSTKPVLNFITDQYLSRAHKSLAQQICVIELPGYGEEQALPAKAPSARSFSLFLCALRALRG